MATTNKWTSCPKLTRKSWITKATWSAAAPCWCLPKEDLFTALQISVCFTRTITTLFCVICYPSSAQFCSNSKYEEQPRCLKITEKVSFNIASEASYVCILSGQKLFKNAKNGPFWRVFENLKIAGNSDTRQVSFNWTKNGGKCQNSKVQMRHFE